MTSPPAQTTDHSWVMQGTLESKHHREKCGGDLSLTNTHTRQGDKWKTCLKGTDVIRNAQTWSERCTHDFTSAQRAAFLSLSCIYILHITSLTQSAGIPRAHRYTDKSMEEKEEGRRRRRAETLKFAYQQSPLDFTFALKVLDWRIFNCYSVFNC